MGMHFMQSQFFDPWRQGSFAPTFDTNDVGEFLDWISFKQGLVARARWTEVLRKRAAENGGEVENGGGNENAGERSLSLVGAAPAAEFERSHAMSLPEFEKWITAQPGTTSSASATAATAPSLRHPLHDHFLDQFVLRRKDLVNNRFLQSSAQRRRPYILLIAKRWETFNCCVVTNSNNFIEFLQDKLLELWEELQNDTGAPAADLRGRKSGQSSCCVKKGDFMMQTPGVIEGGDWWWPC